MTFRLEAGDMKIPSLEKDLQIYYGWCHLRGAREATGELHNCTKRKNGVWPDCNFRHMIIGEWCVEFYILSAGGQPIEKWREWHYSSLGWRGESQHFELLWRSPFSNFSSVESPRTPLGGSWRYYNGGDCDEVFVRIKVDGDYWELAMSEKKKDARVNTLLLNR